MGIIQKQAIKSTFFSYAGTIFGFLNASILMPKILLSSDIGLLTFVNSTTKIMAAIFTLGVPLITQNLFTRYKNPNNKNNGFLSLIIWITLLGAILGSLLFFLLKDQLISSENNAAKYYVFFSLSWVILFVFRLLFLNLDIYLRMNQKTVLGVFLENFLTKIIFLFGLIAYILGIVHFDGVYWMNILAMSFPGLIILLYLISRKERFFSFKYIKRYTVRGREIGNLALFGMIGGIGSTFVTDIDKYMISNSINLSATGIYSVMMLFGMFTSISSINLKRIATPVVADSWKNKDMKNIDTIYKKSAVTQFLIGFYIFLGIWFCIDYVMQLLHFEVLYSYAKNVILFIALGQIIELATGVNAEIIATSKSYKWNTFFYLSLVGIVYTSNLIFIPIYGIEGAALATAVSFLIVNVARYFLLKIKYNLSPFSKELGIAILIGLFVFALLSFIPVFQNGILGILLNGILVTVIFWGLTYVTKISLEVNGLIIKMSKFLNSK
ncbi:MAG: oligosaccharide flippase family protein [Crocinitomicaceae bacterium]